MGKPPTREIAGLVWTYDPERMEWRTPCGLCVGKDFHDEKFRFRGWDTHGLYLTLTAACEAEVAHREATRASPTLDPGELDRMLGEVTPANPPAQVPDPLTAEREAQRRDERAYYRNLAGWAVAAMVLAALCSGVLR